MEEDNQKRRRVESALSYASVGPAWSFHASLRPFPLVPRMLGLVAAESAHAVLVVVSAVELCGGLGTL